MLVLMRSLGILLFPLFLFYTAAVYLRNKLYDLRLLKSCTIDAPVVSIGNIQVGGTGKTPFVEYLAKKLEQWGYETAILTRGYRRESNESFIIDKSNRLKITPRLIGDEPYLLHQNLPSAILGVDADRCRTAQRILEKHPQAVFLLDDGFQHRRISRDFDIVLIDVSRWSDFPFLFPLTSLRDVKSSLRRGDVFILTRMEGNEHKAVELENYLTKRFQKPVLRAEFLALNIRFLRDGALLPVEALKDKKAAAFCGLANPAQFFGMLNSIGTRLVMQKQFDDHHHYRVEEIEAMVTDSRQIGADLIVTTQKDAVKLAEVMGNLPKQLCYLEIAAGLRDECELDNALKDVLNKFQKQ